MRKKKIPRKPKKDASASSFEERTRKEIESVKKTPSIHFGGVTGKKNALDLLQGQLNAEIARKKKEQGQS